MQLAELLRYEPQPSLVVAYEWPADAAPRELLLGSDAAVAEAIAHGIAADDAEALRLALLALALTARQWRERPTDARRGRMQQSGQTLRAVLPQTMTGALGAALAAADQLLVAGADAEAALLTRAEQQARAAERAAERCARQAEGLLDDEDRALLLPRSARTLDWLLRLSAGGQRTLQLTVPAELADTVGGRRIRRSARELGVMCVVGATIGDEHAPLCLAEAGQVALDGSVALTDAAFAVVQRVRPQLPVYALAPDGPDPDAPAQAALDGASAAPELISAIITSRGTYRPAMVARFLSDRDAPLDVIPLL